MPVLPGGRVVRHSAPDGPVTGQIQISAPSRAEAEKICAYLERISARHVVFTPPQPDQGAWRAQGAVTTPR